MRDTEYLNRPMVREDLPWAEAWGGRIRPLMEEYSSFGLPAMNGSFRYSNLVEGPAHLLTCHPYRMWEYGSLFTVLGESPNGRRFVDIGGAASPLVYYLAAMGYEGLCLELQPLLVDVCNYVSSVRKLKLKARVGDILDTATEAGTPSDFATMISVLEHIDPAGRGAVFAGVRRLLKPGGLLYLTFDYGDYREPSSTYRRHLDEGLSSTSASISDLDELCLSIEEGGFKFLGNDPRSLPQHLLDARKSPESREVMALMAQNIGPVDSKTPWGTLGKYLLKRLLKTARVRQSRYDRHNFFRMFLEKTA